MMANYDFGNLFRTLVNCIATLERQYNIARVSTPPQSEYEMSRYWFQNVTIS